MLLEHQFETNVDLSAQEVKRHAERQHEAAAAELQRHAQMTQQELQRVHGEQKLAEAKHASELSAVKKTAEDASKKPTVIHAGHPYYGYPGGYYCTHGRWKPCYHYSWCPTHCAPR